MDLIMRQVPRYLIIGNGRVARHFNYYFSLLNLSVMQWSRAEAVNALLDKASDASHILILISDDFIESFIQQHLIQVKAMRIHFSGSFSSKFAIGAHPLMTFGHTMYPCEQYEKIPFIIDEDSPDFDDLLPGLKNNHVRLKKEYKSKYHALCTMAGNFSCLLWQKLFSEFEEKFNIPSTVAHPYLKQQMNNILLDFKNALTGPLVRGDKKTIENHLTALENDAIQQVYKSFFDYYYQK